MARIPIYEYTNEDLMEVCNQGLEYVLKAALDNGVLTDEKYAELLGYKLVIGNPSIWGRMYSKMKGIDETNTSMFVVRPQEKSSAKN